MSNELSMQLPGGIWQRVREVRNRVAEAAKELPDEVRAATVMVTAELVENAVKYGESVPACQDVLVHVVAGPARVIVEVSNGVSTPTMLRELFDRVEQIQTSDDREALYIGRLSEMLSTPGQSGKLGLYRIGYEGNFDLECNVSGQVLMVRATRVLA